MLPDGQLVSGGAEGHVQFWDSTSGTLTQGFQRHEASVLTLAASPNGDIVFAAGIDEQLVMLRKITGKDGAHPNRQLARWGGHVGVGWGRGGGGSQSMQSKKLQHVVAV